MGFGAMAAAAQHQLFQADMVRRQGGFQDAGLIHGVKSGQLNRNEFNYLNQYRNRTEQIRARMAKNGLSPSEMKYLARRGKSYDRIFQRYRYGNYHPRTRTYNKFQKRQLNQSNRIFNGLRNGTATSGEGMGLLHQQRGISRHAGYLQRDGRLSRFDRQRLNGHQNRASGNIWRAKHNWINDWQPPWFRMFM